MPTATINGGFERDLFFNPGENTLTLMLPVHSRDVRRLIGLVPSGLVWADAAERPSVKFAG